MMKSRQFTLAVTLMAAASAASAANLWVVGDATPWGWDLDKAASIISTDREPELFTGTLYLKAGQDFKFLTQPDWGNQEFGAAEGAALDNGTIALASGTNDEGYGKLQVAEDGNYLISVDTRSMTATIGKSAYQTTPVELAALYLVGDATPGGWDVMSGLPLQQNPELPTEFKSTGLHLLPGSFKIAGPLKGASSWNPEYWYFRSADSDTEMVANQEGDLQWSIADEGEYTVTADLATGAISIVKGATEGIVRMTAASSDAETEYYTLTGIRTAAPQAGGLYIVKKGSATYKTIVR